MYWLNENIYPTEFADVFEQSFEEDGFNQNLFLRNRDNFCEAMCSIRKHNDETVEETASRFDREPQIEDPIIKQYSVACAKYYARRIGVPIPQWALDYKKQDLGGYVMILPMFSRIESIYENTPPEFLEYDILTDERDYMYR